MQLTVSVNGQLITSKPFDFEALAEGYEAMAKDGGLAKVGDAVVKEMFRGTIVTDDVLNMLKPSERLYLGRQAADIFYKEVEAMETLKKQKNPIVKIKVEV